jgi:hypothetical protein
MGCDKGVSEVGRMRGREIGGVGWVGVRIAAVTQQLVGAQFVDEELFPSMLCAVMTRFW